MDKIIIVSYMHFGRSIKEEIKTIPEFLQFIRLLIKDDIKFTISYRSVNE